ncbi:histidine--tRNA ligase [Candidatus Curtissbacteria bacterium RIFCSPLOWO2_01_FULL_41_18]|uniref:Histidine--tRNA ligase n=2 Tax=Candidatus Curtissiibacteriota TaxID=1752717 RepID=A0A1F5FZL1_9BACT|nr:MAG: histidine--tRNA ligase [Candidatus Curtissbacteria bacterium RIFCSPHIGHO2_01_FULL_41_13]OGE03626.1 MAG: histidine--tRNA ligase [Candidatus Curtissbacteria bacterium RIFCSPLOWO2_01_FULL_41_18]
MQKAPPTPKGFRDIPPDLAKKRQEVIGKIVAVLEEFGFVPIETPTIEFASTLKGKYGEEEKLIYEFKDRGGRDLALRYDLTVPLARYVATYNPKLPFRRYQIGQVFRGENPQHGRWREFTQLDFDTVGSSDLEEDAKIIAAALKAVKEVGLKNPQMIINDRKNFAGLQKEVIIALDKLEKIGEEAVISELIQKGLSKIDASTILQSMRNKSPTDNLKSIFKYLQNLGINQDEYEFNPLLARGLDYYTGAIFELKPTASPQDLSIGSGGRYDNLIGSFSKKDIPAVGFSFGIDRLIEVRQ